MRYTTGLIGLSMLGLAACGQESEPQPEAMQSTQAAPEEAMATQASAQGTITAIDRDAGTVTIDHGAVPEVEWPAMTMTFTADETALDGLNEGDTVDFKFETSGSDNEILSIRKN